jgi:polysaccharide biosynthesis transport protein
MNKTLANQPVDVEIDVRALMRSLVRALPYVFVFVGLVSAGVYFGLSQIAPKYRAQATILIETGESEFTRTTNAAQETSSILDQEAVASQVQLLQSRDLARAVAQKLNLDASAEFNPDLRGDSIFSDMLAAIGLGRDPSSASVEERVLEQFEKNLSVFAIEKSRVIAIEFVSEDPDLAAAGANAVAEEYIALQRAAKRDTTADAAAWLETEIGTLRTKVQDAEAKVEEYRAGNDLFDMGGQSTTTLPQQQLADLNAELSRVRAERAEAQAKAEQIKRSIDSGTALNQTEVINSPLIQRLVEQQVALRAQIAQSSATLLPEHPRMREMIAQVTDLDRQIQREAQKILQGLESDAQLAGAREAEIQQNLSELKSAAARANDAGVDLRALEREAAAQRELLDSYLRRYREALARQQGDYLPADARIISRAAVPISPYFPKTGALTAASAVASLLLAIALILMRELASGRPMRRATAEMFPALPDFVPAQVQGRWDDEGDIRRMMPAEPTLAPKIEVRTDEALSAVVGQILTEGRKRILVTMAEESDSNGRPLAAVAIARTIARHDRRPVLIDLRGDGADSASMGEGADLPGFSDLFAGEASFAQVIFRDRKSRVHFIPGGLHPLSAEDLADERVGPLLSALDHTYDHVILDVADDVIEAVGVGCDAAVVVSEFGADDPRTIRAFERIAVVPETRVILFVVDPGAVDDSELDDLEAAEGAAA